MGWVACMLKNPAHPRHAKLKKKERIAADLTYYKERPMERLYQLKNAELAWFKQHEDEDLQVLEEKGYTGISSLISRLETQYSNYLNR